MAKEFEIDAYRKGRELLVMLRGRLVLAQCPDAKSRLNGLVSPQVDQMYLHLGGLSFIDSAGLGVLVGLKMETNRNRARLTFLAPPARVEDIFRVSKLDTIFEIRGGAEADIISSALQKDEFCLWRDSKDSRQALYNTDVNDSFTPRPTLTQPTTGMTSVEDESEKVRRLCLDALEYIRQGDYGKAIESYQRALAVDPKNLSALNNLGIVYEKNPQWYESAQDTWKKMLELSTAAGDEKHAARARRHLDSISKLMST